MTKLNVYQPQLVTDNEQNNDDGFWKKRKQMPTHSEEYFYQLIYKLISFTYAKQKIFKIIKTVLRKKKKCKKGGIRRKIKHRKMNNKWFYL